MTLATFAIIFSAVALVSAVATLIYAVRIRAFIAEAHNRIDSAECKIKEDIGTVFEAHSLLADFVAGVLSNLGLEKKPEQQK